jgi:hypothetical protein
VLGSDEPHYTASRLYPALMAGRPVIAVVHRASSLVRMIEDNPGVHCSIVFDEAHPVATRVTAIADALIRVSAVARVDGRDAAPLPRWSAQRLAGDLGRLLDDVVRS